MIAAGEVVERPSSVVKELVENAIDADAKIISIHLIDSGIKEITVIDNGCGMSNQDALMAFSRHATSKIKNEYDLNRIHTLGFRGEAMPSIASVSNMKVLTNDGTDGGFEVCYKAGTYLSSQPKACNLGTTVTVSNLFFNTPARLKYLKSLSSELASTVYLIGRIALSKPHISFLLTNNKKEIIKTSGNNDIIRLFGELYGLEVAKNILLKEYNGFGYKFKMVLVKPQISRTTKNEITIITNGRFVKSAVINNAIIEGYNTYIPIGRYPIACLYLEIDPLLIDVNVHPSKQQIKISNEIELSEIIAKVVKEALEETNNIYEAKLEEINAEKPKAYAKENIFEANSYQSKPLANPAIQEVDNKAIEPTPALFNESYDKKAETIPVANEDKIIEKKEEIVSPKISYMQYIGQFHGTYLLFQNDEGLHMVDQHAAAERIRYEYFYELLGNPEKIRKALLIPYNIEFSPQDMLYIEENNSEFLDIGFLLEQSSSNSYFIREVPAWMHEDDMEDIVRKILQLMIDNKEVSVSKFRDSIAKSISCKSSIKANKALSNTEIDDLMRQLRLCKNPYNCPHGRPTIVKISSYEIEKLFKRVM